MPLVDPNIPDLFFNGTLYTITAQIHSESDTLGAVFAVEPPSTGIHSSSEFPINETDFVYAVAAAIDSYVSSHLPTGYTTGGVTSIYKDQTTNTGTTLAYPRP